MSCAPPHTISSLLPHMATGALTAYLSARLAFAGARIASSSRRSARHWQRRWSTLAPAPIPRSWLLFGVVALLCPATPCSALLLSLICPTPPRACRHPPPPSRWRSTVAFASVDIDEARCCFAQNKLTHLSHHHLASHLLCRVLSHCLGRRAGRGVR